MGWVWWGGVEWMEALMRDFTAMQEKMAELEAVVFKGSRLR